MRTRHMPTLEAIRFGETMRHVASVDPRRGRGRAGRGGAPSAQLERAIAGDVDPARARTSGLVDQIGPRQPPFSDRGWIFADVAALIARLT